MVENLIWNYMYDKRVRERATAMGRRFIELSEKSAETIRECLFARRIRVRNKEAHAEQ